MKLDWKGPIMMIVLAGILFSLSYAMGQVQHNIYSCFAQEGLSNSTLAIITSNTANVSYYASYYQNPYHTPNINLTLATQHGLHANTGYINISNKTNVTIINTGKSTGYLNTPAYFYTISICTGFKGYDKIATTKSFGTLAVYMAYGCLFAIIPIMTFDIYGNRKKGRGSGNATPTTPTSEARTPGVV